MFSQETVKSSVPVQNGVVSRESMQGNPDSRIKRIFACGIRNPKLWELTNDKNPESKFYWQRLKTSTTVPRIRNPWREVQNPRLSWSKRLTFDQYVVGSIPEIWSIKIPCGTKFVRVLILGGFLRFFQQFPQMKIIANTFYRKNSTRENILQLI